MSDPVTALAERLAKVPQKSIYPHVVSTGPDADALASEALAFAREQLPTEEDLKHMVHLADRPSATRCECDRCGPIADTLLRDLRARLGGGKRAVS